MKKRLLREKEGVRIPIYYYGQRFESMRDLANHLELTLNQVKWALTDRYQGEILGKEVHSILESNFIGDKCYFAFNKPFKSFSEISEYCGIKENVLQMIYFRNKNRNDFEQEVLKRMTTEPITFDGIEYESLAVLCGKHKIDYPTFIRRVRIEGKSFQEALITPIQVGKGLKRTFRGVDYPNIRELYNNYNYSRSLDSSFKKIFPEMDSIQVFDYYLKFIEENGLEPNEEMLTTIPMVYYEGKYYNRAITFYEEIGITSRNISHEKTAKENIGLELEQIILNMATRINKHTGELRFPNCTINPKGKLLFVKNQFEEHMKSKINQLEENE